MRSRFILVLTLLSCCGMMINSQSTYVPDNNFEQALIDLGYDDVFDDYVLTASISGVVSLNINYKGILDLTGIEDFASLRFFYCMGNQLASLDISQNTELVNFSCDNNQLTSLDVSQNTALVKLYCGNNQLTSLDLSQNTALTSLICSSNQLTSLDVSQNTALTSLYCHTNQLTSLDVSQNTALTSLRCSDNQLTSLDVSQNTALTSLNCSINQLISLDVSQHTALTSFICDNNQLLSLDVRSGNNAILTDFNSSNNPDLSCIQVDNESDAQAGQPPYHTWQKDATAVYSEDCGHIGHTWVPDDNFEQALIDLGYDDVLDDYVITAEISGIASLDVSNKGIVDLTGIEDFVGLTSLDCSYNQLTGLDLSQNTALTSLICSHNQLAGLNVRNGNTSLITVFNATNNPELSCIQVDNEADANAGLSPYDSWQKDATASYSEDCSGIERTYIPDNHFEQVLIDLGYDDVFDDYVLTASISGVVSLIISYKGILDLTGIEDFASLRFFYCSGNQLASLDVSQNTELVNFSCDNNQLTSLDVSQNTALLLFSCGNNQLTSLDVSQNTALTSLYCHTNQLTSLDVSQNTALTSLRCSDNQLISLDVSLNTALTSFICDNNQLISLDVRSGNNTILTDFNSSNNPDLSCIQVDNESDAQAGQPPYHTWQKDAAAVYSDNCGGNENTWVPDDNFEQALIDLGYDDVLDDYVVTAEISGITSLDLSNKGIVDLTGIEDFTGLTGLSCGRNQLTSLDISNAVDITYLYCNSNQIASLDVSNNTKLKYLYCYYNQLGSLDVSQNTALIRLRCYNNQLNHLDVSSNTELTELSCGNNELSSLDVSNNTLLTFLNCESNDNISSLDVSQNTALVELWCGTNMISALDVSANLQLEMLSCYNNGLTSLDVSQNTQLKNLVCMYNSLTSLDLSQNRNLVALACFSNLLDELDMRNGNNLNVTGFDASANNLTCINVDDETADHSGWTTDLGVIFSNDCSHNTPQGDQVEVQFIDPEYAAFVEYERVMESGNTSMESGTSGPSIPEGFAFGDPARYFDINTTASYAGTIQISIYFGNMIYYQEDALRLLHYENNQWVDVTTMIDFDNSMIYGEVSDLSPFVIVEDLPPVIEHISAPVDPVALGNPVGLTVTFTDNELYGARINWGDHVGWIDGVINGDVAAGDYNYTEPGVYAVSIQLEDARGHLVEETYRYIVIYNALEGFVTGGGWINSPAGASSEYPAAIGKANFGFVSKYKKGSTIPTGNTEFQFKAGDLNFDSYVYDWLVIAGAKAKFKGEGTINGEGKFGFMISAIDGDLTNNGDDLFRIKIWDKTDGDKVVYDNQLGEADDIDPTTLLGGGSISIHKSGVPKRAAGLEELTEVEGSDVRIYPNPFENTIYIDLLSEDSHQIIIEMIDMHGRIIEHMFSGLVKANIKHHFELNTSLDLIPGYYMLRIRNEKGAHLGIETLWKH